MKLQHILLIILVLVFIGQAAYYYPQLPAIMASHFNAGGQANGFASKTSFFIFEGVLLAVLVPLFAFMSNLLSTLPNSVINLPHKDYWLSPEKREETFAVFGSFFSWMAVAVIALFIIINQIVIMANLSGQDPNPTQLWALIILFLIFIPVLAFFHLKRFFGATPV